MSRTNAAGLASGVVTEDTGMQLLSSRESASTSYEREASVVSQDLALGNVAENLREVDSTADAEPALVSGNVSQEPCRLLDLVSSVERHTDTEQWPGLTQCGSCFVEAQGKAECPSPPADAGTATGALRGWETRGVGGRGVVQTLTLGYRVEL